MAALGREAADFVRGALGGYDYAQRAEQRDLIIDEAKEKKRERDIEQAAARAARGGSNEADKPDLMSRIGRGFMSLFERPAVSPAAGGAVGGDPQAQPRPPAAAPPSASGGALADPNAPPVPPTPPPAPPQAPSAPQAAPPAAGALGGGTAPAPDAGSAGGPPVPGAAAPAAPPQRSGPPMPQTNAPPMSGEQIVAAQAATNGVRPGQPISRMDHLAYIQKIEEIAAQQGRPEMGQRLIARYWAGLQQQTVSRMAMATAALQAGNADGAAKLLEQGYNLFMPQDGQLHARPGANGTLEITRTGADGKPVGTPMTVNAQQIADMAVSVSDPGKWADLTLRRENAAETRRHNRASESLQGAGIAAANQRHADSERRADAREARIARQYEESNRLAGRREDRMDREAERRQELMDRGERTAVFDRAAENWRRRIDNMPENSPDRQRTENALSYAGDIWNESQVNGLRNLSPDTVMRGLLSGGGRVRVEPNAETGRSRLYGANGVLIGEVSREWLDNWRRQTGNGSGSGPLAPTE